MDEVIWETGGTFHGELSGVAATVVAAVAAGHAGPLFPPVARTTEAGMLTLDRQLAGPQDAALVATVLRQEQFRPLRDTFSTVDEWCRRMAGLYRSIVAPGVLTATNGLLFGPLITEVLTGCAADKLPHLADHVVMRRHQYLRSLELFLHRFVRDRDHTASAGSTAVDRPGWPTGADYHADIVSIAVRGGHSCNGGQRLIQVRLASGASLAYRPRPVQGAREFLAAGTPQGPAASVFDLLNRLPPAAGPVELPTLASWSGSDHDAEAYGWQEWIGRPLQWGVIRDGDGRFVSGLRLPTQHAPAYWQRAGSLAAACAAFGIAGLSTGDLRAGITGSEWEPRCVPMGLEYFFQPAAGEAFRAIAGNTGSDRYHGANHSTAICLLRSGDGWRLVHRDTPWDTARSRRLVADSSGDSGCRPYLSDFLTGMFNAWTLICRERERLAEFLTDGRIRLTRVALRPTGDYTWALWRRLITGEFPADLRFNAAEREQLERGDVPYFVAEPGDADLWTLWSPPDRHGRLKVEPKLAADSVVPPQPQTWRLVKLGEMLRRAVDAAGLPEADRAAFDWPQVSERVTFSWDSGSTRMETHRLATGPAVG